MSNEWGKKFTYSLKNEIGYSLIHDMFLSNRVAGTSLQHAWLKFTKHRFFVENAACYKTRREVYALWANRKIEQYVSATWLDDKLVIFEEKRTWLFREY